MEENISQARVDDAISSFRSRGKQINWILSPKVYLNWFSIPTGKFEVWGRRLSIKLGYFHVMFTWKPEE